MRESFGNSFARARTHSEGTGELYLLSGEKMSMRGWDYAGEQPEKEWESHDYEVMGFVIDGSSQLHFEDGMQELEAGDAYHVPPNTRHKFNITGYFRCVEVTAPPTFDGPS